MSSGNDAAYGLAALNGGVPSTVDEPGRARRRNLGAHDTVVVDPSGLDAPGQQSSAYDLALIGRAAIANPDYVRIATTKASRFPGRAVAGRARPSYAIGNHNRLLWNYPGTIGVKNGFTKAAHRTFIGAARRGGKTYLVTEMYGTGSRRRPAASLLDWAFAHGDQVTPIGRLVERGEVPEPLAAPAAPDAPDAPQDGAMGDSKRSDEDSPTSMAAAFTSSNGAVTPSLLPLAGGAALVGLLLVSRRRGRERRRR